MIGLWKIPSRNGWWLGVPPWLGKPPYLAELVAGVGHSGSIVESARWLLFVVGEQHHSVGFLFFHIVSAPANQRHILPTMATLVPDLFPLESSIFGGEVATSHVLNCYPFWHSLHSLMNLPCPLLGRTHIQYSLVKSTVGMHNPQFWLVNSPFLAENFAHFPGWFHLFPAWVINFSSWNHHVLIVRCSLLVKTSLTHILSFPGIYGYPLIKSSSFSRISPFSLMNHS